MSITVNIPTNAERDARIAKALAEVNEERVFLGLTPYADANAMARDSVITDMRKWEQQADHDEISRIRDLYRSASDAIRQKVKDILDS